MDLTIIIQVAVGMIFVWVILAVITSQIQDWIASILTWRASFLEATITQMLDDPNLKDEIYNHPLIQGLYTNGGKRKPAGIPEDKFALVLFEHVMNSGVSADEVKNDFERLKEGIKALKKASDNEANKGLKNFAQSLDTLLIGVEEKADDTTHAITEARARVEGWFNNSMDRLGGAYKRRMQIVAIVTGIIVAVALNVDSAAIVKALWTDPVVRQAVVAQANQASIVNQQNNPTPEPNQTPVPGTQTSQTPADIKKIAENVSSLSELSLPIGWSKDNLPKDASGWGVKIVGLLISGMAAAQGAPYWFDLMRKLLTRNPPVPPEPS